MSVWNDPEMGEYLPDPSMENMDEEYRKSLESLGDDETCCYLISESKRQVIELEHVALYQVKMVLHMILRIVYIKNTGEMVMQQKW